MISPFKGSTRRGRGFNNSTIQQFNNSTIQQFNNSTIQQFNNSTIQQFNNSTIQQFNNSTNSLAFRSLHHALPVPSPVPVESVSFLQSLTYSAAEKRLNEK